MEIWIQIPIFKFRSRIKSAVQASNEKMMIITDIYDLRRKKFWSGTRLHIIKEIWRVFIFKKHKSHTYQEKKTKNIFLSLVCFHQTSKNKNVTGNIIHNSSEVILLCMWVVWVISLSTLTLTEREDKIKNKLTIFV